MIDPQTADLLEERTINTESSSEYSQVPAGTVTSRVTLLAAAIVPGLAVRPDGTQLDTSHWRLCTPLPGQANAPGTEHCVDR